MESLFSEKRPLVLDIIQRIEKAISALQERTVQIKTADDFLSSPSGMEKLDAACMVLIAIGESIKNLDKVTEKKLLETYPSIRWKDIMGVRDVIAHHYFDVDADEIFYIIKNDLEPLKEALFFFKQQLQEG
ncbi:MAG: DUF86 domain-containing protein [Bacteroidaceae bacterium]|nr:DUF86 domain-containing protein [Bacteroidaceae bacterium]